MSNRENRDLEKQIQDELWVSVIEKNAEKQKRKTPSESEDENIHNLLEITGFTEKEIRSIAFHVRKRILQENNDKKNQKRKNKRKKMTTIVAFAVSITLFIAGILFIGQCIKNTADADALCEAAGNGNYDKINLLLSKGANINAKDFIGRTALIIAVDSGHATIVRLLINKGANTKIRDDFNQSAIDMAEKNYNQEIIKILGQAIAESTPPNSTIRKLWNMGFTFTGIGFYNAIKAGNIDAVKLFVSEGMNPTIIYNSYWSGLEIAVMDNHVEIVSLFLSIIPKKTTEQVAEAFSEAVKRNKIDIVRMFLDWGIDMNKADDYEIYLLFDVTDYEILKLLLENGIDVNTRDIYGSSVLFRMILISQVPEDQRNAMIELLLEHGANPNVSDKNGRLIDQVIKANKNKILQLLYQAGAEE